MNQPVQPKPIRYLGIDPGLNRTGYSLLQVPPGGRQPILLEGGIIRSTASLTLAERVVEIGTGLEEILEEFEPDMMGIEQVFTAFKNPKSALMLAHARGAILYVAASRQMTIVHYTPTQIKKMLTGSGKASKEQIQHAVTFELKLEQIPEPNDVADATAVALCLFHSLKFAA
ncbi:Crossover junction endodeoxyribonuclease RuvC [Polystyrenella longa]|uniref:Crossover junction endodeoxyribonuclease RuvC n=1 Tax=Polystyrenella longa TaxID=2528007 RepID=A0A518CJZ6_9PLAN|nr:crossover junction endodeoxyribonuclease RuvC [Polystyrenella longa]QDU79558.1 Crossover junction endodeoxyribonuclease RuvC [Polystyrenella longa]